MAKKKETKKTVEFEPDLNTQASNEEPQAVESQAQLSHSGWICKINIKANGKHFKMGDSFPEELVTEQLKHSKVIEQV